MHSFVRRFATHLRRLRSLPVAVGALTLVVAAQSARAQGTVPPTGVLRFDTPGALAFTSPYGPADVGRLGGTFLSLPGQPHAHLAVDLFCVDILHSVSFDPAGWNVYLTNLGGAMSIDYTRQGTRYADSMPDALMRYRKAAWLSDQYASVLTVTDTAGIQGAMWLQFESTLSPFTYANAGEATAVGSWLSAVDTFAASGGWSSYQWDRFTVVTDVNSAGLGADYRGLQEMITSSPPATAVPEPATFALFGAGLTLLGGVAHRRRANVKPSR